MEEISHQCRFKILMKNPSLATTPRNIGIKWFFHIYRNTYSCGLEATSYCYIIYVIYITHRMSQDNGLHTAFDCHVWSVCLSSRFIKNIQLDSTAWSNFNRRPQLNTGVFAMMTSLEPPISTTSFRLLNLVSPSIGEATLYCVSRFVVLRGD